MRPADTCSTRLLLPLVLLASSCTEAPPARQGGGWEFPSLDLSAEFLSPALIGVEPGFDAPVERGASDDAGWRAGDEVVYGITMRSPSRSQQWLVRVRVHSWPAEVELANAAIVRSETIDEIATASEADRRGLVLLEVETYDEGGKLQDGRRVLARALDLAHGVYPGCQVWLAAPKSEDGDPAIRVVGDPSRAFEELRTVQRSGIAFQSLFAIASNALKPIVDTVVERPSIVEVFLHGGIVQLTSKPMFFESVESGPDVAGTDGTVLSFPFEILVYDSLALSGRMFVAESRPPLLPVAGIVAVKAVHPNDPESTVAVRLLSARRGTEPLVGAGGG